MEPEATHDPLGEDDDDGIIRTIDSDDEGVNGNAEPVDQRATETNSFEFEFESNDADNKNNLNAAEEKSTTWDLTGTIDRLKELERKSGRNTIADEKIRKTGREGKA